MKIECILMTFLSLSLLSCSKEDTTAIQSYEISASFDKSTNTSDTKTNIGDDLHMFWTSGDHLYLVDGTTYKMHDGRNEFILSSGEGAANGVFKDRGSYYNIKDYTRVDLSTPGNKYYVTNTNCYVSDWTFDIYILNDQTYNPDSPIGLANGNIIPLYGAVITGSENLPENNIKLSTPASIIMLKLTNKTLSDINIGNITMTSSITGRNEGLAGRFELSRNGETMSLSVRNAGDYMSSEAAYKTITLDCNGEELKNNATKVFSFVLVGGYDLKTLTWKVYSTDGTTQLGSDIITNPSEKELILTRGMIYTKTGDL